jgi:cyclopropane fatty-acyl-phospholipid synthase-like methyltransferase
MDNEKDYLKSKLTLKQFPLSARYDIGSVNENEMGPNSMWLTEFLSQNIELKKGMKVLDLGCGKAISSIFLAKEFGVEVWAVDWWISAERNMKLIKEMGVEQLVHAIHAEAHNLPFDEEFFDVILSMDAYHYFGTDEMYFEYITSFLKSKGEIGIVVYSSYSAMVEKFVGTLGYRRCSSG